MSYDLFGFGSVGGIYPLGGACNCGNCNPFQGGYGQMAAAGYRQDRLQSLTNLQEIMRASMNAYPPQSKLDRARSYAAEVRKRKGWDNVKREAK